MPSIRLNRALVALILALPLSAWAQKFEVVADRSLEASHSALQIRGSYKDAPDYLRNMKLLTRPSGGLVGHVRVSNNTASLTARLRLYQVKRNDLLQLKKPPLDQWFQPSELLKENAPQRGIRLAIRGLKKEVY